MAARIPRRTFAAPFVVTLATLPACVVHSHAAPDQAPPAKQTTTEPPITTVTNPPRPMPDQPDQPPVGNPPPPEQPGQPTTPVATRDRRWHLYRDDHGSCTANFDVTCPPNATCNPPPPVKVACPAGWDGKTPATIAQYQGQSECKLEVSPPACPPGAACNPPRPMPVACPER